MFKGNFEVRSVTATGAAMDIELGFDPSYVVVTNDATGAAIEWHEGMTNGHAIQTVAAGTRSKITTLGISRFAGTAGSVARGITIGANAAVNINTNTLRILAVGKE